MFPLHPVHAKIVEAQLRHLLIGGQAINAYGVPRATIDVDFLIPAADRAAWRTILESEGFRLKHDSESFLQFSPPYGVDWPLDLMLVNEHTFEQLASNSRSVECLGITIRVPAPERLIALKLHALVHGSGVRMEKDFPDVVRLARMTGIDPQSDELRAIFKKHGTDELYERFLKALQA